MNLIDFEWIRSSGAYSIVELGPRQVPHGSLVLPPEPGLSTEGKKYFETYRPTDFPALFQQFADMPETAEGMRDFFNTFGPLEWWGRSEYLNKQAPGWYSCEFPVFEVLAHHGWMRRVIRLLDAGSNISELAEGFRLGGGGGLLPELRPGADGRPALFLVPSSLLQFLWLQFAQYAGSDAKLFRCEQCNLPFLVGTGTSRRSQAKYCSDACRHAAFRQRRAPA